MKKRSTVLLLVTTLLCTLAAWGQQPKFRALAFYSNQVEPDHVQFAVDALKFYADIAAKDNFSFEATTDFSRMNYDELKKYQLVIWLNAGPSAAGERAAFEKYMENGGAWIGFHGAAYNDASTGWPWFVNFLGGAVFHINSWPPLPATLKVDDPTHPATAGLPPTYVSPNNEWYVWKPSPRLNKDVQVLLSVDQSNYPLGLKDVLLTGDLPVAWSNKHYKMAYINMGHGNRIFTSAEQNKFFETTTLWLGTLPAQSSNTFPPASGTETSAHGVVINPKTHKVYAVNTASGTVTIIDSKGKATTVKVGNSPEAISVNPVTNKIYVANEGSASVSVIDGVTDIVSATVSVGNLPYVVAVNPATNKIYVSKTFSNAITVIDGKTNQTKMLRAGIQADMIAVNPTTNKLYLVNYEGNDVMVLDGNTDVPAHVMAGNHIWGIEANTSTNRVYLPVTGDSTLAVINGADNTVSTVKAGTYPCAVAVDQSRNRIYATNYASNDVTVIDGTTNSVIATVPAGARPRAVAVNPVNRMVFVANSSDNTVTVIDGKTNTVLANVKVDNSPFAIAVESASNKAYVTTLTGQNVIAIDGKTLKASPVEPSAK